ncbi:UDP-glucoronosyl and UDP-glucosyl transferase family protein [Aphelenchoides avenae]|nr:UDP-glucoronosyl and UDP-glucosyl transferase family protein [Aphelenchus avenae]
MTHRSRYLLVVLALEWSLFTSDAYKFLVYSPKFGTGHVLFMGKLADVLAQGGHEVVVYQPGYDLRITTSGTKYARVIERNRDFDVPSEFFDIQEDAWNDKVGGFQDMSGIMKMLSTALEASCDHQLGDKEMMDRLEAEKFDLALGEHFDVCFYAIAQRAGIPRHISVFSTFLFPSASGALGVPTLPSFMPGIVDVPANMTYLQRMYNSITLVLAHFIGKALFVDRLETVIRRHLGSNFGAMESTARSSYFFVNSDEHVEFARPISHKIIYIAGIGMPKASPLDGQFEAVMNSSTRGVVLVSFGTVGKSVSMSEATKTALLKAFVQFPDVTFLWKYERPEDNVAEGYPNVVTVKWVPQIDLLGHPRLLAFITHAGMNSISETVSKGVPMICVPLFGDQQRNAKMVESRNIAIVLKKNELTTANVAGALRRILIADSAKEISRMVAKKPLPPDERVLKYAEFAAEFDVASNLDIYGRYLNFCQFYSLDVICPLLGGVVVMLPV